ncbi:hypothetical protein TREMEDRAFT_71915 [Tremella mesenterica DSM 1558]|nr:uncharacterized protein TREMEDRAFT_71915 [Tremella mesenterica DSM 1558]EIW68801.1 hypothetical protein TREMEDRAFT_71915 [Tremella mesenterica DSM 1558]
MGRRFLYILVLCVFILVVHRGRKSVYSAISLDDFDPPYDEPQPPSPSPISSATITYEPDPIILREIDISSESLPLKASLRERLEVWRNAPGGRGEVEGEVEAEVFNEWSLEQCSTIQEQHNTYMINKDGDVWASMNRTTLHEHRMELINHMDTLVGSELLERYGEGRGIVMVAGNADTLQRAKWSLMMLRSYGSQLPVQIYHFPSERPPDDDPIREEFASLGAELVEAVGREKDEGAAKNYHLKAISVIQCPWREVLYLDSDSIPVRDPTYMFSAPNYRRLGLWATPDYWKTSAYNSIWAILGVKCRNEWEMETGQMFIDKKRHLDVFFLVQYMLERHTKWFHYSDGDKDIFRWALLALRKRWAVPGRWVGAAALPRGTLSGEFCSHSMLQYDSWGEPLFLHYTLLKHIPSGIGRGFSWGRTKQLPLFNTFPATPATARLGEPLIRPMDDDKRGLGDVDCDMLADADEYGLARAPAKEMIMRRAVRERGARAWYHGGGNSALCIDLNYIDPRPQERKDEDEKVRHDREAAAREIEEAEQREILEAMEGEGVDAIPGVAMNRPVVEGEKEEQPVYPDWGQSPLEVVQWSNDPHLASFENNIYDFGFKPTGQGF